MEAGGDPSLTSDTNNNNNHNHADYVTYIEALRQPVFSSPANISSPDSTFINIALVLIQDTKEKQKVKQFLMNMKKTLGSLLTHSSGSPLHLIIITSKSSILLFGRYFAQLTTKKVSEFVIESVHWKWRMFYGFPNLKIPFVDIEYIMSTNKPFFLALKRNDVG